MKDKLYIVAIMLLIIAININTYLSYKSREAMRENIGLIIENIKKQDEINKLQTGLNNQIVKAITRK